MQLQVASAGTGRLALASLASARATVAVAIASHAYNESMVPARIHAGQATGLQLLDYICA